MVMETKHPNPFRADYFLAAASSTIYLNQDANTLVQQTLDRGQGKLSDTGALCIQTGKFTGRSPKDRFIVRDKFTENTVDWGEINIPIAPEIFDNLLEKMEAFIQDKELWVRRCYAGANPSYRLHVTVINTTPWANLFCHHLFLRPAVDDPENDQQEWTILQVPEFLANPAIDQTRQENFTMINFSKKMILIGGSAYTGEMKKGIFSVLNFILPHQYNVLPMHCSANEGEQGDVALFFGLSGTGKTTLSADVNRKLIGDDEHGWADDSVFNFEGGCYAKCIDLHPDKEPQIYAAIKHPTLLENVGFFSGTNKVDFSDAGITENTRAAYPIDHIKNAKEYAVGNIPENIFFLTCDAFGVLPPIAKLTKVQAMYHFLSGYTAKVAGTEVGVREPQSTFSACFGRVFLPLHPTRYAELLGKKLDAYPEVNVWLVNTGWTGGTYGIGKRISLHHTRAMVQAAIQGHLTDQPYTRHPHFGVLMPKTCPGVPVEILNPRNTWKNKEAYDKQAETLAKLFVQHSEQYQAEASQEIRNASPGLIQKV